jgi:hypothetical protein
MGPVVIPQIKPEKPILQACNEWLKLFCIEIGKDLVSPCVRFKITYGKRQSIN